MKHIQAVQVQVNNHNYYTQFSAYVHGVCVGEACTVECYDEHARVGIEDEYLSVSPDYKYSQRVKFALWKAMELYAKERNYPFICINCSGEEMNKMDVFLNKHDYKTVTIVCKKEF